MAPKEFSPKGKLDTKKVQAVEDATIQSHRGLSRSNTDSSGNSDIPSAPVPAKRGPISKAGIWEARMKAEKASMSQSRRSSSRISEHKQASFENSGSEENSPSRRSAQKKIVSEKVGTSKKPNKGQKEVYLIERIIGKGWIQVGSDDQPEWCYLIQWAGVDRKQRPWKPSWEPLSLMNDGGDKQTLAGAFEERMKEENPMGAPDWAEVLEGSEGLLTN